MRALAIAFFFLLVNWARPTPAQSLTHQLNAVPTETLVAEVMQHGDPRRGALLFHLERLQCVKCHAAGTQGGLGPSLTDYDRVPARASLIESILQPSRQIREDYQTVSVITAQGVQVTGLLVKEDPQQVVLRDVSGNGDSSRFAKSTLEHIAYPPLSIMPSGLADQLLNRTEFLDLARFVIEVAEGGASRAAELGSIKRVARPLPTYEAHVDHAGLIRQLDEQAVERGARIYQRVCANCHGTLDREGSLPTSPRFARVPQFKNGSDPYRMYQTLTHGFGFMVAQRWMVPRQKYDVIHFIRESFLREHNSSLYTDVTEAYLQALPVGDTAGPDPSPLEPYRIMDYGPTLLGTYEIALNNTGEDVGINLGRPADADEPLVFPDRIFSPGEAPNFAYKGIAVRLDPGAGGIAQGAHWFVYDHDTMQVQAAWSGGDFIDFAGIHFDGRHGVHPRLRGTIAWQNPVGPGWAQPHSGTFRDPRPTGRDGRPYGPLPDEWLQYDGLYHCGDRVVLAYRVGDVNILEHPTVIQRASPVFVRQLWIGPSTIDLRMNVARADHPVAITEGPAHLRDEDGFQILEIPASTEGRQVTVTIATQSLPDDPDALASTDPRTLIDGGPSRWPLAVHTSIKRVHSGEFIVDQLELPHENPWNARLRPTGLDFFRDSNRAAVCTWDGDVWIVCGLNQEEGQLAWKRVASGLFQPLGLKILNDQIYVSCRDQLVQLQDLNEDGEIDFYRCFNNDHQVTEHFHEFAMGLQADSEGNFYYAKSARHAKHAIVPHHGTLLKVDREGRDTQIMATGFRAANGVCLNPDGTFFVTDQEGHWTPKNRINHVEPGGFYGNIYGYTDIQDLSDEAMQQPLCWITNQFDRSPAELLWIPPQAWGPLGGGLLNLSYGEGKVFIVPHEVVEGQMQGGMIPLPIPEAPSGVMRGRFSPQGDLFVAGMFSWSGNQTAPGVLQRVRYDGAAVHLPVSVRAHPRMLELTFSHPLDVAIATETDRWALSAWDIERTPDYGSEHHDTEDWPIEKVSIRDQGRTVRLTVPDLRATRCYALRYRLQGSQGRLFQGEFHGTVHELADEQ